MQCVFYFYKKLQIKNIYELSVKHRSWNKKKSENQYKSNEYKIHESVSEILVYVLMCSFY